MHAAQQTTCYISRSHGPCHVRIEKSPALHTCNMPDVPQLIALLARLCHPACAPMVVTWRRRNTHLPDPLVDLTVALLPHPQVLHPQTAGAVHRHLQSHKQLATGWHGLRVPLRRLLPHKRGIAMHPSLRSQGDVMHSTAQMPHLEAHLDGWSRPGLGVPCGGHEIDVGIQRVLLIECHFTSQQEYSSPRHTYSSHPALDA